MSSNYWQTKKQSEQFKHGNSLTSKINAYVETWESRCYQGGIPDEVPAGIAASGRAPSYKAIAMAILRNDHSCKSLGLSGRHSQYYNDLKELRQYEDLTDSDQRDMFMQPVSPRH